jgi:hypothetical protein
MSGIQSALPRLNTMNVTQNSSMPTVEELSMQGALNVHGSSATSTFNPFQNST